MRMAIRSGGLVRRDPKEQFVSLAEVTLARSLALIKWRWRLTEAEYTHSGLT